jgi:flagellar P-ring protein precursor FlgI
VSPGSANPLRTFLFAFFFTTALVAGSAPASAASRIKDLADVEGVRDNLLIGYGLVVGLDGTGDRIRNTPFTRESLVSMLERMGVNIRSEALDTENIAAVMVTANLPAFATQGTRIDVSVSALGDAESLRGGVLLVTPLHGADGEVYAIAQGSVAVSGFSARGQAASVTRGVPTNGRIANGAVVERELSFNIAQRAEVRLALRNPDFTTARRIAGAINENFSGAATVIDPGTVRLSRPAGYSGDMVGLVGAVEGLRVEPDHMAKVVIDEASGVIVMGADVRVSTVAIAQGTLTISVSETPQASQPSPFSEQGETIVLPRTDVAAEEEEARQLKIIEAGVRLSDLVDGLNALGVSPRDMIAILQAIKASGALQADIEVM